MAWGKRRVDQEMVRVNDKTPQRALPVESLVLREILAGANRLLNLASVGLDLKRYNHLVIQ